MHDPVPFFDGNLGNGFFDNIAVHGGIVDKDIDFAETIHGRFYHGIAIIFFCHVGFYINSLAAGLCNGSNRVASVQNVGQHRWSGDAQLWWIDGKPGDRLALEVPVETAGSYRVTLDLTKAVDYGIVKLQLAGQDAKQFDRYHTAVANDPLDLGTLDMLRFRLNCELEPCLASRTKVRAFVDQFVRSDVSIDEAVQQFQGQGDSLQADAANDDQVPLRIAVDDDASSGR